MKKDLTVQQKLKLKGTLKEASLILDENEYLKLEKLLISKNFREARDFIDTKIENCVSTEELLVLKIIENHVFDMTNI